MYIKYILSILILASSLFSANIRVIESYDLPTTKIKYVKATKHSYKKRYIKRVTDKKRVIKKTKLRKKRVLTLHSKELPDKTITKKRNIKKASAKNVSIKSLNSKRKKAKLVIIIDDVSHLFQLKTIQNLPFKVTPSIFPPTKMNMQSYKLARGLKHFMVHLPLESHSKQMNTIYKLIRTYNTQKQIDNRIKEIRHLFPNAKYINNHTGSKFSANYTASKKLYKSLVANGFKFVDSRTSSKTKFPRIAREFNKRYLKSDLFIDNVINTNSIKKEIRKGIALAKRRGYAVIIGHPHPQTMRALRELSKAMQSVTTVYIDEF